MYEQLKDELETLYNSNSRGIMLQMLNACRRCHIREEECMNHIMSILRRILSIEEEDYASFIEKCLAMEKTGGKVRILPIIQCRLKSMRTLRPMFLSLCNCLLRIATISFFPC